MNHVRPLVLPEYTQLLTHYDVDRKALWHYLNPSPRPCFTPTVLEDISDLQARVRDYRRQTPDMADSIRYVVMASAVPQVYNLGGDLDMFARCIVNRDREALRAYAYRCVDCVLGNALHLGQTGLTTISLVQGKALGGGFEAALSCNVVVAERGVMFGFPEILFNLFPGMGAYSLLVRRIDPIRAERLIRSGDQYSSEALFEMGVVDVLAERGEGMRAVHDYIRRQERAHVGFQAIQQLREWNAPLTREELVRITDLWVESALQINERDLRTMIRLATAQYRLAEAEPAPAVRRPAEFAKSAAVRATEERLSAVVVR